MLDEISSHLDEQKLLGLLQEVRKTNIQTFITAVSKDKYKNYFQKYDDMAFLDLKDE